MLSGLPAVDGNYGAERKIRQGNPVVCSGDAMSFFAGRADHGGASGVPFV